MTSGEDEAVAVEPARLGRVDVEEVAVKDGADFCTAEGQPQVAGCAIVNGVDGESACLIGGLLKEVEVHAGAILPCRVGGGKPKVPDWREKGFASGLDGSMVVGYDGGSV